MWVRVCECAPKRVPVDGTFGEVGVRNILQGGSPATRKHAGQWNISQFSFRQTSVSGGGGAGGENQVDSPGEGDPGR